MLLECMEVFDDQPCTEARRAMFGLLAGDQRALYAEHWSLYRQQTEP
jgi:hypothetical protein